MRIVLFCRLWHLDHTGEVLQNVLDEYSYCAIAERKFVSYCEL